MRPMVILRQTKKKTAKGDGNMPSKQKLRQQLDVSTHEKISRWMSSATESAEIPSPRCTHPVPTSLFVALVFETAHRTSCQQD